MTIELGQPVLPEAIMLNIARYFANRYDFFVFLRSFAPSSTNPIDYTSVLGDLAHLLPLNKTHDKRHLWPDLCLRHSNDPSNPHIQQLLKHYHVIRLLGGMYNLQWLIDSGLSKDAEIHLERFPTEIEANMPLDKWYSLLIQLPVTEITLLSTSDALSSPTFVYPAATKYLRVYRGDLPIPNFQTFCMNLSVSNIQTLILPQFTTTTENMSHFANCLGQMKHLNHLKFLDGYLNSEDCEFLTTSLRNSNLLTLNLSGIYLNEVSINKLIQFNRIRSLQLFIVARSFTVAELQTFQLSFRQSVVEKVHIVFRNPNQNIASHMIQEDEKHDGFHLYSTKTIFVS